MSFFQLLAYGIMVPFTTIAAIISIVTDSWGLLIGTVLSALFVSFFTLVWIAKSGERELEIAEEKLTKDVEEEIAIALAASEYAKQALKDAELRYSFAAKHDLPINDKRVRAKSYEYLIQPDFLYKVQEVYM